MSMFKKADGLNYYRFLKRLHENHVFDWYMEIGCREGLSFAQVRSKTIAVDPFFRAEINIIGQKPALHVFQQTSDAFFASDFLAHNKIKLSVSFLDGMHLIEYLLRDFIATEAQSDSKGVIMMHDTAPYDAEICMRDLKNMPPNYQHWTGDVWKIWPILQKYRPDLKLTMMDCKPTGLMVVTGLNNKSRILSKNYKAICAEFQHITMAEYGVSRFMDSFDFTNALETSKAVFPMFDAISIDQKKAVVPKWVTP